MKEGISREVRSSRKIKGGEGDDERGTVAGFASKQYSSEHIEQFGVCLWPNACFVQDRKDSHFMTPSKLQTQ